MIVIGLLLLILVIVVVVLMVMVGASPVHLTWNAVNLDWTPTALTVYLLGAGTLLMLVLAFAALRAGARSKAAKRRELKRLRQLDSGGERRPGARGKAAEPTAPLPTDRSGTTGPPSAPESSGHYGPDDNRLG